MTYNMTQINTQDTENIWNVYPLADCNFLLLKFSNLPFLLFVPATHNVATCSLAFLNKKRLYKSINIAELSRYLILILKKTLVDTSDKKTIYLILTSAQ